VHIQAARKGSVNDCVDVTLDAACGEQAFAATAMGAPDPDVLVEHVQDGVRRVHAFDPPPTVVGEVLVRALQPFECRGWIGSDEALERLAQSRGREVARATRPDLPDSLLRILRGDDGCCASADAEEFLHGTERVDASGGPND